MRSSEGDKNSPSLPTDISIIRDEVTGLLIAPPLEVIAKIADIETVDLSLEPTLPPGAPFPWLAHVLPTPSSSIPMVSGCITPSLTQEALRRSSSHKAERPDGAPGLVFKYMPPSLHEAIHFMFYSMTITMITLPPLGSKVTPFSSPRKGTLRGWITIAPSSL